jgi:hypothetical protein
VGCPVVTCANGGSAVTTDVSSSNGTCSCTGLWTAQTNCTQLNCGSNGTWDTAQNSCVCNTGFITPFDCGYIGCTIYPCSRCDTTNGYGGPSCAANYCGGGGLKWDESLYPPSCLCKPGWKYDNSAKCTLCDTANGYGGPSCTANYCGGTITVGGSNRNNWYAPYTQVGGTISSDIPTQSTCICNTTGYTFIPQGMFGWGSSFYNGATWGTNCENKCSYRTPSYTPGFANLTCYKDLIALNDTDGTHCPIVRWISPETFWCGTYSPNPS